MASNSITYWTRLEPRPRSPSIARALRAEVRDPAWFLARQWQFGEHQGADSGSPAFIELRTRTSRLSSWRAAGTTTESAIEEGMPLETAMLSELADDADWSLAVELAQTFEWMLRGAGIGEEVVALYRPAYELPSAETASDEETRRFLLGVGLRSWNGLAYYQAAAAAGTSPAAPAIPPAWQSQVDAVVLEFLPWVLETYGGIVSPGGAAAPKTWVPERLRYTGEVCSSGVSATDRTVFDVHPGPRGELDWYSLELPRTDTAPSTAPTVETKYTLPGNVRFRGMPNARFWDMEPASTDYGALEVDRRDLARMVITELALTQGNDWFVVGVPMAPGSVVDVDWLLVHDVFGQVTLIRRANADPSASVAGAWRMFSPTIAGVGASPYFVLPDVAAQMTESAPLEDVRFVRDEVANMAWAIEKIVPNGLGEGRHRRDLESEFDDDRGPPASTDTESPVRYVIQTEVPREWIPLVPQAIGGGEIVLTRAAMLDTETGDPTPLTARGRIIGSESSLTIREEEVPRSGVHVVRRWQLTRRADGTTDIVLLRRRAAGTGEGHSGLRFDTAVTPERT